MLRWWHLPSLGRRQGVGLCGAAPRGQRDLAAVLRPLLAVGDSPGRGLLLRRGVAECD
jgi:hypothetical protein